MKHAFLLVLALGVFSTAVASDDVKIQPTRRTLETEKKREGGNQSSEQSEIAYKVVVTSKAFRTLPNVTIRYNIFYADSELGSTADPEVRTKTGSHTFESLLTNKPVEFITDPVKLEAAKLDSNWYFKSGAKNKAEDKVVGLWFKAFDETGKQVGEYKQPSTVATKRTWKE